MTSTIARIWKILPGLNYNLIDSTKKNFILQTNQTEVTNIW